MVDEGSEDQRPCRNHSQKAECVGFGQLADGRTVSGLNREHAEQPFSEAFDPLNWSGALHMGERAGPGQIPGLGRIRPTSMIARQRPLVPTNQTSERGVPLGERDKRRLSGSLGRAADIKVAAA